MKLSMKRTCKNCRAIIYNGTGRIHCCLGFKIESDEYKPLEPCPKPTTVINLINCMDEINERNRIKQ